MTKIVKIKIQNLKSVKDAEIELNGSSIIVTGANDSGKSTILTALIQRIKSEIPDKIVRQGEKEGYYEMELSDGVVINWNFNDNNEILSFRTKEGYEVRSKVIETLQKRYFSGKKTFDINKFINISQKEQRLEVARLLGIDLAEIDSRLKIVVEERKNAKKELSALIAQNKKYPDKVEEPDIESLKKQLSDIRDENIRVRNDWHDSNEKLRKEVYDFNLAQKQLFAEISLLKDELSKIKRNAILLSNFIDFEGIKKYIENQPKPEEERKFEKLPEPEYKNESEIEKKIDDANKQMTNYVLYKREVSDYEKWINEGKFARQKVNELESIVAKIENEKKEIIEKSQLPVGFSFTDEGILYNGFELNRNALSSSALYIAGLKLAILIVGELESIYFDSSFLDKENLRKVMEYANSIGLQLLIERPDYDCGELRYEIINQL